MRACGRTHPSAPAEAAGSAGSGRTRAGGRGCVIVRCPRGPRLTGLQRQSRGGREVFLPRVWGIGSEDGVEWLPHSSPCDLSTAHPCAPSAGTVMGLCSTPHGQAGHSCRERPLSTPKPRDAGPQPNGRGREVDKKKRGGERGAGGRGNSRLLRTNGNGRTRWHQIPFGQWQAAAFRSH